MKKKASRDKRIHWKLLFAACLLGNSFCLPSLNSLEEQNLDFTSARKALQSTILRNQLRHQNPLQLHEALKELKELNRNSSNKLTTSNSAVIKKEQLTDAHTPLAPYDLIKNTPLAYSKEHVNSFEERKAGVWTDDNSSDDNSSEEKESSISDNTQQPADFPFTQKHAAGIRLPAWIELQSQNVNRLEKEDLSTISQLDDVQGESTQMKTDKTRSKNWKAAKKLSQIQKKGATESESPLPAAKPSLPEKTAFNEIKPAFQSPPEKKLVIEEPSSKLKIMTELTPSKAELPEKNRKVLITPTGEQYSLTPNEALSLDQTLDALIAQGTVDAEGSGLLTADQPGRTLEDRRTILIRFNNISIIEYIRYLSRVTNKNFIFDENELLFNVTIVSEEPTTIDDVLVALIQVLRIHGLNLIQNGDDFIIYQNPGVRGLSKIEADTLPETFRGQSEIVTRVFALNTLDANDAAVLVKSLLSDTSIVQPMAKTNSLVVTDFRVNTDQVSTLLKSMDSPQSGLTVGQYAVRNTDLDALVQVAEQVMQPIAQGQILMFVPQKSSESIFIISTPFLLERVIPILQRLDQNSGTTGVYDLKDVEFRSFNEWKKGLNAAQQGRPGGPGSPGGIRGVRTGPGGNIEILRDEEGHQLATGASEGADQTIQDGHWSIDPNGSWIYNLPQDRKGDQPPRGRWATDGNGNWIFQEDVGGTPGGIPSELLDANGLPAGNLRTGLTRVQELQKANAEGRVIDLDHDPLPAPRGRWTRDINGNWQFVLDPGESITSTQLTRFARLNPQLPVGFVEQTKFYIHKLQFRKGDMVQAAIQQIGTSLSQSAENNAALLATINSVQWLEESNSLVIAGPPAQIEKVRELILEIDTPLRQVFIEMLILDTTVDDALNYGVNWGSKFGGGDTAGAQGFVTGGNPLANALGIGGRARVDGSSTGSLIPATPDASPLAGFEQGYTLGIIGRNIVHKCFGLEFSSIGALVEALHQLGTSNIVLNPKIVTEDNVPAEIFVGINTRFLTQSISNDQGSIVTSNFEFRDVGTRMKVTPMLGPTNIITLEIEEEVSSIAPTTGGQTSAGLANLDPGPTTRKSNTKTRVHLPDGFFLILSGNINDDDRWTRYNVPCLGGIPYIGSAFSNVRKLDTKRNLLIFIRPKLIDTEEEMVNITRHQQDVWKWKNRITPMWKHEVEGALEWGNIRGRVGCGPKCDWEVTNEPIQ